MDSIDMDECFTEEMAEKILFEIIDEFGYTVEELYSITDEDEFENFMYVYMERVYSYMGDVLYENLENKPLIAGNEVAKLQKINGRWLIVE